MIKDDTFDLINEESWCLDNDKFLESIRYGDTIPGEQLADVDVDEDLEMSDECGVTEEEIIHVDPSEIITYSVEAEAEEQVGSPSSNSSGGSSHSSEMYDDQNVEVVQLVGILPHGVKTFQIVQQNNHLGEEMHVMDDSSSTGSEQNAYQDLKLSEEEKRLLSKEGISLPSHYPLTKYEERELKRIRRKIRNKISAQDSRKRKKEYLDKLQQKVQEVEEDKSSMAKKVRTLEAANAKLQAQVKRLQIALANATSNKPTNSSFGAVPPGHGNGGHHVVPAATTLLVLILSLALVVLPTMQGKQQKSSSANVTPGTSGVENAVMTAFEDGNPNMSIAGRSRTMVGVGVPMGKRPMGSYEDWNMSGMDEPIHKIPRFSFQTPGVKKTGLEGIQNALVNELSAMRGKLGAVKRPFHGDVNDIDV
jgi:hypothetical protein